MPSKIASLKSNMDRFIVVKISVMLYILKALKSNMDRFIVLTLHNLRTAELL